MASAQHRVLPAISWHIDWIDWIDWISPWCRSHQRQGPWHAASASAYRFISSRSYTSCSLMTLRRSLCNALLGTRLCVWHIAMYTSGHRYAGRSLASRAARTASLNMLDMGGRGLQRALRRYERVNDHNRVGGKQP